jgi:glutamate dehydrogenase (NAD(P)+)
MRIPLIGAPCSQEVRRRRPAALKLDPGIWRRSSLNPKRQIVVSCPVQMDTARSRSSPGTRVQYNVTLGPAKGRHPLSAPDVSLDEVTALARG